VELAPVSASRVEQDWRGQLADYMLGQQSGPEATATRGHLRRSEAARTWARSLLDSLDQLYENGSMPAIPEGERGSARARRPEGGTGGGLPGAEAIRRRRGIAIAGALAAVALMAILLWPIGVLTGDGDDSPGTPAAATQGGSGSEAAGLAVILGQGSVRALSIAATGLEPSTRTSAYEVWLYDSPSKLRSLGKQTTTPDGTFPTSSVRLPKDFAQYRFIDVSREPLGRDTTYSGDSVLRGRMPRLTQVRGNRLTRLGQVVLAPPAG
jgi:hypothetical protein